MSQAAGVRWPPTASLFIFRCLQGSGSRDHVFAHGPVTEVDLTAALAAEREVFIGLFHGPLANRAFHRAGMPGAGEIPIRAGCTGLRRTSSSTSGSRVPITS